MVNFHLRFNLPDGQDFIIFLDGRGGNTSTSRIYSLYKLVQCTYQVIGVDGAHSLEWFESFDDYGGFIICKHGMQSLIDISQGLSIQSPFY